MHFGACNTCVNEGVLGAMLYLSTNVALHFLWSEKKGHKAEGSFSFGELRLIEGASLIVHE